MRLCITFPFPLTISPRNRSDSRSRTSGRNGSSRRLRRLRWLHHLLWGLHYRICRFREGLHSRRDDTRCSVHFITRSKYLKLKYAIKKITFGFLVFQFYCLKKFCNKMHNICIENENATPKPILNLLITLPNPLINRYSLNFSDSFSMTMYNLIYQNANQYNYSIPLYNVKVTLFSLSTVLLHYGESSSTFYLLGYLIGSVLFEYFKCWPPTKLINKTSTFENYFLNFS